MLVGRVVGGFMTPVMVVVVVVVGMVEREEKEGLSYTLTIDYLFSTVFEVVNRNHMEIPGVSPLPVYLSIPRLLTRPNGVN